MGNMLDRNEKPSIAMILPQPDMPSCLSLSATKVHKWVRRGIIFSVIEI